ncbi:hypothetical protein Pcinc_019282 [Petrolisthes cinctipes]|uniref:TIR domain-containing protein n=1 Tax=Petrolisthes cinctipes TaxID=88211 RepID=A0AAE1FLJ6_PETCI|nr:hypothetical protein Pcinc_019282 [Petrolisthes cinctipes]
MAEIAAGSSGIHANISKQAVLPRLKEEANKSKDVNTMSNNKKTQKESRPETTQQDLRLYRELLLGDLYEKIGLERTVELYTQKVKQNHFLLIYADEDRRLGETMRDQLETEARKMKHNVSVVGPWDVTPGDIISDVWERLSFSSQKIVVLVSRALFQNDLLTYCLYSMDVSHVTPVFLEALQYKDFPPQLAFLRCRNGKMVHDDLWDLTSFVRSLLKHYDFHNHLVREIKTLKSTLNFQRNLTRDRHNSAHTHSTETKF